MSAATHHHVCTGSKVSECVCARGEGKEEMGCYDGEKGREKRRNVRWVGEGGNQLSARTHHHVQTGSKVTVCLCAREWRRWPAGEEESEEIRGV